MNTRPNNAVNKWCVLQLFGVLLFGMLFLGCSSSTASPEVSLTQVPSESKVRIALRGEDVIKQYDPSSTATSTLPPSIFGPATPGEEMDNADAIYYQEEFRLRPGFEGEYYRENPPYNGLIVLKQSVSIATHGRWSARGLVRNQFNQSVGEPKVTVMLENKVTKEIERCTTMSPVSPIRRGEPAPFELSCKTPASQVGWLRWSTTFTVTTTGPFAERDFGHVDADWWLPYGDRESLGGYIDGYTDPKSPPYPYFLYGSTAYKGNKGTKNPTLITAWLDEEGKVLWITKALALPPGVGAPKTQFEPTDIFDFALVVDNPEVGPKLYDNHNRMVWVGGY